jgi:hypothetical protein
VEVEVVMVEMHRLAAAVQVVWFMEYYHQDLVLDLIQ